MLASSLPTACISAQQEPAKSHRSSLTLWSAEHVFVLIFLWFDSLGAPSPPWKLSMLTDTQEALAFPKCPSYQTEVVVLLPNTRFMTNITSIIWGGFVFVCFFNLLKAQTDQTVIWPNSQQPRHTQQGVLEKVLETNCLFCGANWTKGKISTFLFVFTLKPLKKKKKYLHLSLFHWGNTPKLLYLKHGCERWVRMFVFILYVFCPTSVSFYSHKHTISTYLQKYWSSCFSLNP